MNKLLIADDNSAITDILKLNFQLLGYNVRVARNGEEAEQLFDAFKPDIMILDVMMPKKDGFQVCRKLKSDPATASVPIILLTAKTLPEDVRAGLDCNANAYVTKPYNPSDLEVLVAQLMEEARTGKRSVAWTGLPHSEKVKADYWNRREDGGDIALFEMLIQPQSAEVYIQKYGNARFRDFLHRAGWKINGRMTTIDSTILMGQSDTNSFVFCTPSSKVDTLQKTCEEEFFKQLKESTDDARKALKIGMVEQSRETVSQPLTVVWNRLE